MVENNNKVIIFGVGAIAEEVANYLKLDSKFNVEGFTVDKKFLKKKRFMGKPVVSFETITKKFNPNEYRIFIAIGYTNLNKLRIKKYQEAKKKGYKFISYVSSKASLIGNQKIKDNCLILENTTIQTTAKLGNNIFIWSNNLIGHHAKIKDNTYIAGNCTISGNSTLGLHSFMGVNSTITHGVKVGTNCFIGANSFINKNLPNKSITVSESSKRFKFSNVEIINKIIK